MGLYDFKSPAGSNIIPTVSGASNLGDPAHYFDYLYVNHLVGSSGTSGFITSGVSLGTGFPVFNDVLGSILRFNSISGIGAVTVSSNGNLITISGTDTGEVNTASNVGTGNGWFKQKSGLDLQFKTITSGNNIVIINNTDDLNVGMSLTPTFTSIFASLISGTTINSDTVNSKIVSGTTINNDTLNSKLGIFTTSVNSSTISGTTISGNTATITTINNTTLNGSTGLFTTTVNSPIVSGTTVNSDTHNNKGTINTQVLSGTTISGDNITGLVEMFSPIISGSTISGNTINVGITLNLANNSNVTASTSGNASICTSSVPISNVHSNDYWAYAPSYAFLKASGASVTQAAQTVYNPISGGIYSSSNGPNFTVTASNPHKITYIGPTPIIASVTAVAGLFWNANVNAMRIGLIKNGNNAVGLVTTYTSAQTANGDCCWTVHDVFQMVSGDTVAVGACNPAATLASQGGNNTLQLSITKVM